MRKLFTFTLVPLALALAGCPTTDQIDHMEHQPKVKSYRTSEFYSDGSGMRAPPADTVSQEHDDGNPVGEIPDGGIAAPSQFPMPITADVMALGKHKFDTICAVCHGYRADGDSVVARKMSLRPPPNITTEKYRAYTDGQIFMIITNGFGYMNPYRDQLSSHERWAVVAYLRALQLSQNVSAQNLTADEVQKVNAPPARPSEMNHE